MEYKKPMSHVLAGLLIAALVIVIAIITMAMAQNKAQPGSGFLTYAAIIAGLIITIRLYGKAKGNNVTFGELFSYGFKATAVYTIIFIVFLILYSLLFPELKTTAIEATRTQIEDQATLSDQQAEQSIAVLDKYFWVFVTGATTLFFVLIGAIGSLIGAAVTKKNPVTPFDQSLT